MYGKVIMADLSELIKERESIAKEIASIESMRKGTPNEQFVNTKLKSVKETVRGPYYVLMRKGPRGKTVLKAVLRQALAAPAPKLNSSRSSANWSTGMSASVSAFLS